MSEQKGETVLLDKLAGSLLDYVEDEDALDGALRLREDLLDKRLMMTARLQHKMVDNLADGQEHRAQAQQFVQSMIDKFRVEVILDSCRGQQRCCPAIVLIALRHQVMKSSTQHLRFFAEDKAG